MPQTGIHSFIGTIASEKLVPRHIRSNMAWGILLGSVIPDIDILPAAIAYLITGKTAMIYLLHRSGTHSVAATLFVLLACWLLSRIKRRPAIKYLGYGLGLGIMLHIIIDIFWWGPVDILWPLGFLGIHSEIYLLASHHLTAMAAKLLGAGEFLIYALYYGYLFHLAKIKGTNAAFLAKLRKIICIQVIMFIAFSVLAFLLARTQFEIVLYAFLVVFFFPLFCYVILKMKPTIETATN